MAFVSKYSNKQFIAASHHYPRFTYRVSHVRPNYPLGFDLKIYIYIFFSFSLMKPTLEIFKCGFTLA